MNSHSSTPERALVVKRIFAAPVALVWQAWTDPNHLMKWWGPDHFTSPSAQMDVREGGTSLVCVPGWWSGHVQHLDLHENRTVSAYRIHPEPG
ncbi:MAG: SRPBCC domain-containing protein [Chloroflexi bacterium]|nr:SRPBCC domain-containing protein [Chloroflexota bacterium]